MRNTPSNIIPRYGHSAIIYDGIMIIYGGRNKNEYISNVSCFNILTMSWFCPDIKGVLPLPRAGHTAVVENDLMYVFGGSPSKLEFVNDLYILELRTMTWDLVKYNSETVPCPRKGHTAVSYNSSMIIFGGCYENMTLNDLWDFCYDTQCWRQIELNGNIPTPRYYHVSSMVSDTQFIVFGGNIGKVDDLIISNETFIIDLTTNNSTFLETSGIHPSLRMCSSIIYRRNKVLILGGGAYSYLSDSYELDLVTKHWNRIRDSASFSGRINHTTVQCGDYLLTFGGYDGNSYNNETLILYFEPTTLRQLCVEMIEDKCSPLTHKEMKESFPEHLTNF